ncbi:MerR family transcriptional regulator [Longispora sp. NPDC051575]|uniref:MerR family transcriptional regulator n=1 Tax=Longispora sp. NPDC051575 TaxID=3154943 RepID=UPI00342A10D7
MDTLLKIGELAARAGVSNRTVDFYTTSGLLAPAGRSPGGFRLYEVTAADRIATIRQLEAHGLTIDQIATALRDHTAPVLTASLGDLDRDLQTLRTVAGDTGDEVGNLVSALTARAHALITTALEIAGALPPP